MENSFINNETSSAPISSWLPPSQPPFRPSRCGDNRPKLCLGRFDSRNAMTPRRNLPQDRTENGGEGANKEKVLRDDNDRCADVFMTSATASKKQSSRERP